MAHAEFVVYTQSGMYGDIQEQSIHRTEHTAIQNCKDSHAKDGRFYEVEFLWVSGGTFGVGNSKGREILDVDYIYYIGAMPGMDEAKSQPVDSEGATICTGQCSKDCRYVEQHHD